MSEEPTKWVDCSNKSVKTVVDIFICLPDVYVKESYTISTEHLSFIEDQLLSGFSLSPVFTEEDVPIAQAIIFNDNSIKLLGYPRRTKGMKQDGNGVSHKAQRGKYCNTEFTDATRRWDGRLFTESEFKDWQGEESV